MAQNLAETESNHFITHILMIRTKEETWRYRSYTLMCTDSGN